uniref:uncharacterized protein LOC120332455 n=1 Tax=Styela clava TaxID=7725 RepID=UPI00193A78AB|nr:uncharacterized protein LOC120332455 [Styela clava]
MHHEVIETAKLLESNETKLYGVRWLVACLLFLSGFLIMFAWHFFGVINEALSQHFEVSHQTIDWLTICAALGQFIGGPVIGYLFTHKPTAIKIWYIVTISLQAIAFTIFATVIYVGKYLFICMIAEVAVGFACVVYFALIPVTATVWFGEREQATVLGIGWFAMMAAVVAASILPSILFAGITDLSVKMLYVALCLYAMSTLAIITLFILCLFIPNSPKVPPSHAEIQRLTTAREAEQKSYKSTLLRFAKESKYIATERTSLTLVLMFTIIDTVFVCEYMLVPANESELELSNSTLLSDDAAADISEMLKQHVYPTVQESTQGIFISLVGSVFCVLLPIVIRAAMTNFGKVQFYVIVLILFVIVQILTLSIKPEMKRFEYESEAVNDNAPLKEVGK